MPETLTTTVTDLPESRVRVRVEVPASELESRVQNKARELGRKLKIPGFRKGKIPPALVIQRVGWELVLEEAIRDTLPDWYAQALLAADIDPVGDPKLELGDSPAEGEPLEFSIEIGVLPKAKLGQYTELEVGRAEAAVAEQQIDEDVERLRERLAKLESVDRAAQSGDFLVIDYVGSIDGKPFKDGEGRDQLLELGSGNLIPGFEEGLIGASAGEQRTLDVTFPAEYGEQRLAGKAAAFAVTVRDVKAKVIPDVDEEFAAELGFDDLAELREDLRKGLLEVERAKVEKEFREAALDAAVAKASVEVPAALVEARTEEMWERMLHALSHRGVSKETYLNLTSQSEEEILAEIAPDAESTLRREAVIAAVVEAENITPSEEELLEALAPTAEREGADPREILERLRGSAGLDELRESLAARKAIDLIAGAAKPIGVERAKAREKLWTPESEEPAPAVAAGKLWTPDS